MKENDVSERPKDEKLRKSEDLAKKNRYMGRQVIRFVQPRDHLKETTNVIADKSKESGTRTVKTPTKPKKRSPFVPVSPTANLKLLTDMASLESNYEERATRDEHVDVRNETKTTSGSRKDKSLSLLCRKFLEKYPEYPPNGTAIDLSLDEVSKVLNVERRRIYDIVNVLESVEMMQRIAKNCYKWYGKMNLSKTLARLKFSAHLEKLDEHFVTMKANDSKLQMIEIDSNDNSRDGSTIGNEEVPYSRKEKSLGAMSKKFVMLFLVVKQNIISLEVAANVLLGETNIDNKSTVYKTKIRRLYDIANILSSLNLIRKVHVSELYGRKPAFEYIGPNVDDLVTTDQTNTTQGFALPSNSLKTVSGHLKRTQSDFNEKASPSKFQRTKSETCLQTERRTLTRHTSLQDVCAVAERERSKINAESSQPTVTRKTSPTTMFKMTSGGKPIQVITFASSSVSVKQNASSSPLQVLKLPLVLRLEKASPLHRNGTNVSTERRSLLVNFANRTSNVVELGSLKESVSPQTTVVENGSESKVKFSVAANGSNVTVIKYVKTPSSSSISNRKDDSSLSLISKNLRMTR